MNLREEIVSGQLPAGTKLPSERDLAKQYEVSQPTIREIMRALDSMGLIEVRHGSGVYVSQSKDYGAALALQNLLQLGGVGIVEVLEVRDALGRASARRAAEMATLEEISDIEEKLAAVSIGLTNSVETLLINIEAFQVAVSAAGTLSIASLSGNLPNQVAPLDPERPSRRTRTSVLAKSKRKVSER